MFNTQNTLPPSALPDLINQGDVNLPAAVASRPCTTVRLNTLVLMAVAIGREHGIGSAEWVEFGALVAAEIGPWSWDVKRRAMDALGR